MYAHKPTDMVTVAGLDTTPVDEHRRDPTHGRFRKVGEFWRVQSRYERRTHPKATDSLDAVSDPSHRVLQLAHQVSTK